MGQKVSPIAFRLGYSETQRSNWFAPRRQYAALLRKDYEIRLFINNEFKKQGCIGDILINRKGEVVEVIIKTNRPGQVVGKKGENLEKLRASLQQIIQSVPEISVQEVKDPDLSAKFLGVSIAQQIERRMPYKRAIKKAIKAAEKAGAAGVKIIVSGRLGGAEIARSEKQRYGMVPLHTLKTKIDYALSEATTTYGIIGIKVWVTPFIN